MIASVDINVSAEPPKLLFTKPDMQPFINIWEGNSRISLSFPDLASVRAFASAILAQCDGQELQP